MKQAQEMMSNQRSYRHPFKHGVTAAAEQNRHQSCTASSSTVGCMQDGQRAADMVTDRITFRIEQLVLDAGPDGMRDARMDDAALVASLDGHSATFVLELASTPPSAERSGSVRISTNAIDVPLSEAAAVRDDLEDVLRARRQRLTATPAESSGGEHDSAPRTLSTRRRDRPMTEYERFRALDALDKEAAPRMVSDLGSCAVRAALEIEYVE
jgi:hypothetical protein